MGDREGGQPRPESLPDKHLPWNSSPCLAALCDTQPPPSPPPAFPPQLVCSRTFGVAAEQGGVGMRMLVPLLDMINHAGDEWGGPWDPAGPEPVARDNVRCAALPLFPAS